jgi:hypothetical protein
VITERRVVKDGNAWVEASRDGAGTVYLLTESQAQLCADIQNETARWRCLRQVAFAKRKEGSHQPV